MITKLFFYVLVFCGLATPLQALHGDVITSLFGDIQMAPVDVDIDNVVDAVNVDGVLHVVGHDSNGVDMRQLINLTTGVKSQVEVFVPQNGSASPGGGIRWSYQFKR